MRVIRMKRLKRISLLAGFLVCIVLFLVGCNKQANQVAQGWTLPVSVTASQQADVGGGDLYKWHDTIILLKEQSIMSRNNNPNNSWTQLPLSGVPDGYAFYCPALDQASGRIMFEQGFIENDQLMMSAIFVRFTGSRGLQVEAERKWTMDQKSLFGETGSKVKFNGPPARLDRPNRDSADLGIGTLNGLEAYVPYSLHAHTFFGINNSSNGPFNNGVFHSTDFGETWQMERISDFDAGLQLCAEPRTITIISRSKMAIAPCGFLANPWVEDHGMSQSPLPKHSRTGGEAVRLRKMTRFIFAGLIVAMRNGGSISILHMLGTTK
jgi:hypothetical protein